MIIVKKIWIISFITGLLMILNKTEISRYISDVNGIFAAGIILSLGSGIGLLIEMYRK